NNQAHDVGELLGLLLCDQLPVGSSDYLLCEAAATQLANKFKLDSGLGGIHLDEQRGLIYDDDNDGFADAFGREMPKSARGKGWAPCSTQSVAALSSSDWPLECVSLWLATTPFLSRQKSSCASPVRPKRRAAAG